MLDPAKVALWISALIGAGTVVGSAIRFFFYLHDEIKKRISLGDHGVSVPKESLRIALKNENAYWWHMGKIGANPAMQIVGDFFITNISDRPVRLPQMELRYGLWGRKRVHGEIIVEGPNRYYGMYDIEPNQTRDSRADFWVFPPVQKANRTFVAHSVVFWDQLGNKHFVRRLSFRYS
jgi:hypothetical protein